MHITRVPEEKKSKQENGVNTKTMSRENFPEIK